MDLAVYIDAAEERILTDRIARLVNGNDWDLVESTYGYLDPLTYTSFLLPYTMTKEWEDQYTGNYARLQPTDYNYYTTTGAYLADVVAQNVRSSGDTYTYSASSVPFIAQTKAEYPMNRPVYISLYTSNVGNSSFRMLECGWGGNTGLGGNDLSCRFWSSGNVEFWRGSKFIGNCNYTDNSKPTNPPKGENIPPPVEQIATATLDIHLIPFRKNEILIVTNRGRTHFVVPDVDINETTPTICASGNFWWYVPNGLVQVQCAPIKFVTAGTLVTSPYTYRSIPTSGASVSLTANYALPGYGTQSVTATHITTGTTLFQEGIDQTGKVRLAITSDGNSTPFVYGARLSYPTITVPTFPVTCMVQPLTCSLNVSESPADTKMTFTFVASSVDPNKINTVGNRAVALTLNGYQIFFGRSTMPKRKKGRGMEQDTITYECQDLWSVYEKYMISEPTPFDTLSTYDAFVELITMPGNYRHSLQAVDFTIPSTTTSSEGKWNMLPDVGDTIATWLLKIKDAFAGNYVMGFKPLVAGTTFCASGWDVLNVAAEVATLYPSVEATLAAGVPSSGINDLWFYNTYEESALEPEANEVWVYWKDRHTEAKKRIVDWDPASICPTTEPSGRPDNWLGEPRKFSSVFPPFISTDYAAKYYARNMLNLISRRRVIGQWTCNFLKKQDGMPVWRGDVVNLSGIGKFRVTSFNVEFGKGRNAATYTGEKV